MNEPLTHECPLCTEHGPAHPANACVCDGAGALTAAQAAEWECATGDAPAPLAEAPKKMLRPCSDCAFRRGSPERDDPRMWKGIVEGVREARPFFCHQGMVTNARGEYVPRAGLDDDGRPNGAPVCAGWARARQRLGRGVSLARAVAPVGRLPFPGEGA